MDLTDVSSRELLRRLDSLATEYDRTVKEAMRGLAKIANLQQEIAPLAAELSRREGAGE